MTLDPRKMAAKRILDSTDLAETMTRLITGLETEILSEVADLEDALGVEHIEELPDEDERQEVLKDLFQAQVQGDLETFYVEHVMADRADQPEKAAKYLDMDADEWADRKDQWAEKYRDAGAGEEIADRTLAEKHVRDVFGVDLDEFEQNVVEWDPGDVMRQVLAGNIRTARNGIRLCRESVEEGDSDA